ncbi:MAG: dTDP-4-dehydrorhamnose 3,5-epimerase [Peptococcaceae bacterium]|nr:dTDP-4-dehydrorhamnose 3,5-epimerase [Peptococcaceae bacterium]
MANFQFIPEFEGVCVVTPKVHADSRGYFMETYNYKEFSKAGLMTSFVQDNQSRSRHGVLRGLHFQRKFPQGKLVRVLEGEIFDVAVDIDNNSNTYGQWFGINLSSDNQKQLYIPAGFAHGFLVLSQEAVVSYKCTDYYYPEYEDGILWNDATLGIKWPLDKVNEVILSEKDKGLKAFSQLK